MACPVFGAWLRGGVTDSQAPAGEWKRAVTPKRRNCAANAWPRRRRRRSRVNNCISVCWWPRKKLSVSTKPATLGRLLDSPKAYSRGAVWRLARYSPVPSRVQLSRIRCTNPSTSKKSGPRFVSRRWHRITYSRWSSRPVSAFSKGVAINARHRDGRWPRSRG